MFVALCFVLKQVLVEFDGGFVALEFCIRMSIVILFVWEAVA